MGRRGEIRLEGIVDLSRGLKKRATLTDVKNAVRLNGSELQKKTVRNADFTQGYQTGTTKRSITLDFQDKGFTAKVAPGTEYSYWLEKGTRKMVAQPFLSPAFFQVKEQFKRDLNRLLR